MTIDENVSAANIYCKQCVGNIYNKSSSGFQCYVYFFKMTSKLANTFSLEARKERQVKEENLTNCLRTLRDKVRDIYAEIVRFKSQYDISLGWDVINDVSVAIIDLKQSYTQENYWEKETWVELVISLLQEHLRLLKLLHERRDNNA
jgi:hypothetical protein